MYLCGIEDSKPHTAAAGDYFLVNVEVEETAFSAFTLYA